MKRSKSAFSLAEMLLVVVMVGCIAVAASSFVIKKNKNQTTKQKHGRYECYYNGQPGQLMQRYTINGVASTPTSAGSTCTFNPTVIGDANFVAITAIGGGGGGAWAPAPVRYNVANNSSANLVGVNAFASAPDWLSDIAATLPTGVTISSWSQNLWYTTLTEGRGGGAGEMRTVYLTRPGAQTYTATVGRGGAAATSSASPSTFGSGTTVTCNGRTIVSAIGGRGSNEYSSIPLLMDGMDSFNNGAPPNKPGGDGGSSGYVADDTAARGNVNTITDYGYGGRGGGSTINRRSEAVTRTYTTSAGGSGNKNVSINSGKNGAPNTNSVSTTTPPQNPQPGKTGAFIVTW